MSSRKNVSPSSPASYLRAGLFLHVMTLAGLALLWSASSCLPIFGEDTVTLGDFCEVILLSFLMALPLFSQLDARSRYQNYKQIKDQLFLYGFDKRIFKPVLKSRCQRDAALAAAEELGYGDKCRAYFRASGYRWYHIVPDFVLHAPGFFLSGAFWRRTFFMPTYQPKVNFRQECLCV